MSTPKTPEELRSEIDRSSNPRQKRLYVKRIENGKCVSCGKVPPKEGRRRCGDCAQRYKGGATAETASKWRRVQVASGRCSKCGKQPHARNRKLCKVCLADSLERMRARLKENPNLSKERKRKLFLECLDAYGGRFCACCGVDEILFLSLDHINNDGAAHRRSMGHKARKAGEAVWFWLKKHKFPPGMQVLCMNCNFGKMRNKGTCPHKSVQAAVVELPAGADRPSAPSI
jgi:hypothetical protein